jgi:hypothetical protein
MKEVEKLSDLLKKVKISREKKPPVCVFTRVESNEGTSAYLQLAVRIPELALSDNGGFQNLALAIKFCCAVTGADQNNVRVIRDATLGSQCLIPAFFQKLFAETISAASNTKGSCSGEVYTVKGDLRLNSVEMLGCIRAHTLHSRNLRKKTRVQGKILQIVEPSELREAYNTHCGLKAAKSEWLLTLIKESLAYGVRPTNTYFPGQFVYAAQERMKVKDTKSLLNHLGWKPIAPDHAVVKTVVFNKAVETGGGKLVIKPLPEGEKLDFPEHRTLVACAVARIDPNSQMAFADQLKIPAMSHGLSDGTIAAFNKSKGRELVDSIDLCFNIYNAVSDPKKPANADHYLRVRREVLRRSAFFELRDRAGNHYAKFAELPEKMRLFLNKEYPMEQGSSKRARPVDADVEMTTVSTAVEGELISPEVASSVPVVAESSQHSRTEPAPKRARTIPELPYVKGAHRLEKYKPGFTTHRADSKGRVRVEALPTSALIHDTRPPVAMRQAAFKAELEVLRSDPRFQGQGRKTKGPRSPKPPPAEPAQAGPSANAEAGPSLKGKGKAMETD